MLKNKRIVGNIILAIFLIPICIFLIVRTYNGFKKSHKLFADVLPSLHAISSEDSTLIAKKYQQKLSADIIYQRKNREPISFVYFDSNYNIIIYKIDSVNDMSFDTQYHFGIERMDRTAGEVYTVVNFHQFEFQYIYAPAKEVAQIYFTLAGDSIQLVSKNDSIISYHLLCNNFSLRYGEKDPVDLLLMKGDDPYFNKNFIPADFLFLKRNGFIYLMIMTPRKKNIRIQPNLLYNIVMGI